MGLSLMVLALAGAGSVHAQQSESPSTFRLPPAEDSRTPGVQGPADNGLPPVAPNDRRGPAEVAPAPQPAPPRVVPTTQPTAPATAPASPRRDAPARAAPTATDRSASTAPPPAATAPQDSAAPPTPGFGPADSVPTTAVPSPVSSSSETAPTASTRATDESGTPIWAWVLAALAATGAGIWYWRRNPVLASGDGLETTPAPTPVPAPAPARVPTQPRPVARATPPPPPKPVAPAVPVAASPRSSPLVTRPAPELRALVSMTLDIDAIRLTPEQAVIAFTLRLRNDGAVDAVGMMVRIALNQGSAMPEPVLARFYDGAGGSVLCDDMVLTVGAGERMSTEATLPRAAIEPLMIGGKPMLIPVLAFDVTYHWDGEGDGFGQNAGSFVLGREPAAGAGGKLAPLPLDRDRYAVTRPGVRATAVRRHQ